MAGRATDRGQRSSSHGPPADLLCDLPARQCNMRLVRARSSPGDRRARVAGAGARRASVRARAVVRRSRRGHAGHRAPRRRSRHDRDARARHHDSDAAAGRCARGSTSRTARTARTALLVVRPPPVGHRRAAARRGWRGSSRRAASRSSRRTFPSSRASTITPAITDAIEHAGGVARDRTPALAPDRHDRPDGHQLQRRPVDRRGRTTVARRIASRTSSRSAATTICRACCAICARAQEPSPPGPTCTARRAGAEPDAAQPSCARRTTTASRSSCSALADRVVPAAQVDAAARRPSGSICGRRRSTAASTRRRRRREFDALRDARAHDCRNRRRRCCATSTSATSCTSGARLLPYIGVYGGRAGAVRLEVAQADRRRSSCCTASTTTSSRRSSRNISPRTCAATRRSGCC